MSPSAAEREVAASRAISTAQLRLVQVGYAVVMALVLMLFAIVEPDAASLPGIWIATAGTALATVPVLFGDRAAKLLPVVVPAIDLAALIAIATDVQSPRVLVLLAVVPAVWLGTTARLRGVILVVVAGLITSVILAARIPFSSDVSLTANAVGALLVPLTLAAAAWFAHTTTGTLLRQQRGILRREREKAAIAKQREEDAELLDAIFETARVGLLLLDPDGRILRVNSTLTAHAALGGDGVDDLLSGATFLELETRRELPPQQSPFLRAARGEAFDNLAFWMMRPGSRAFAITMSSRPLMLDGEFRGSIASVDDVTNYMRMVEDRDDFVALVSHELRTPLTSIAGYLELVLDEELPGELREWLRVVQRNAERLRALVEDLLIVGEMSRGEVHLTTAPADLRMLAADALAVLQHRARRRGIALRLADGPAVTADVDARRITQVIENLISNGIKYTHDDGSVDVWVEHDGADAVVRVVDDGPGVSAVDAARVFERFFRSASARASGVQGAGLGLWICKMLVEEHGGSIAFESEPGRGSTASFRLPGRR